MGEIFKNIPKIQYEGPSSKNPLAFKFYDADREIMGKPMKEHLRFSMAWWHTLCATGADMFGVGTADKSFEKFKWSTKAVTQTLIDENWV